MRHKITLLLLLVTYSIIVTGQEQEKLYYDEDWRGCSKSKAEFYRLVTFDQNGNPIGSIKDYFISGELQGEADGAIKIDKYNDENSIFTGRVVGYLKNGNKTFENFYSLDGKLLKLKSYYENGNLEEEYSLNKQGEFEGNYNTYYESGKPYRSYKFINGELADKFFIEYDEFGNTEKVFLEYFTSEENKNEWNLVKDEKYYSSSIQQKEGLLMETKNKEGFKQTINIPLSLSSDFSIETIVDFKSGETNSGHGLIWGFKNWDDYYYFYISANGYYKIGAKIEGINIESVKWTQDNSINQDYSRNKIKVLRVKDNIYFSINGSLVHSQEFYGFRGNHIGFSILSGKKSVLFENLIVKQEIEESNFVADKLPISSTDNWKGNGTGFFISKDGYIATNYHVIEESSEIEIEFIRNGQKQNYKAKIIQSDKFNDLAILKIDDNKFVPFLEIPYNFKTSISDVGSNVFALGYPMALSVMGTEIKFTDGKISSKTGFQGDISTYQMTTPIQPGNSGGPLFDFDGNLIGVNSAKIRADVADNVSYAIKTSYLKNLIDVLPTTLYLPNDKSIMNKTLTEKIKIISDYVVLIRIK